MPVFEKSLGDYLKFARTGAILILIMGLIRFVVGASGVPYERATHLVSLSLLSFLLAVVYGQRAAASAATASCCRWFSFSRPACTVSSFPLPNTSADIFGSFPSLSC
jgi:hypothetical protein